MKLRKSRLSLAVGLVLGAAAMIPAASFGWSVNTNVGHLQSASGGDTLPFPTYSTVVPTYTSFSATNTSGTQTIAAKIRFREQEHSMDVLDLIVVPSPNDKFDFTVSQDSAPMRPTMSVYHLEVLGVADLTNASAPDLPWDTPNIADVHGVFLPPDTADGLSFISAPALAVNTLDIATGVTATNTNPVILPEGIGSGLVVDWGGPFRGAADGLPGRLVSTAHARILEFPVAMTQEFESKALLVGDFLPAKCVAREGIG